MDFFSSMKISFGVLILIALVVYFGESEGLKLVLVQDTAHRVDLKNVASTENERHAFLAPFQMGATVLPIANITLPGNVSINIADTAYTDFWYMAEKKEWEPITYAVLRAVLTEARQRGEPVGYLDFGAWIGVTVLYGAAFADRSFALEPDPRAFMGLQQHLAVNPKLSKNIVVFNECLMEKTGTMKTGTYGNSGSIIQPLLIDEPKHAPKVYCSSPHDFFNLTGLRRDITLAKVDIEGAEYSGLFEAFVKELVASKKEQNHDHMPSVWLSLHPEFGDKFTTNITEAEHTIMDLIKTHWSFLYYLQPHQETPVLLKTDGANDEDIKKLFIEPAAGGGVTDACLLSDYEIDFSAYI